MSLYGTANEEARRARDLLKDWAGEGYLSAVQVLRLEPEIACDLRRTNIFLRAVLFLFTLLIAGAMAGLWLLANRFSSQSVGPFLLVLAPVCYLGAEAAASRGRLYRHGIEEALAVCFVGFLCLGLQLTFFDGARQSAGILVPVAGCVASGWLWHRFGLPYAALAAMAFVAWMPASLSVAPVVERLLVIGLYAAALAMLVRQRPAHRFTYLDANLSLTEALLWFGIYAVVNLKFGPNLATLTGPAYWATWVLTWCLPPVILWRGFRARDRLVLAAGALALVVTLITNKDYLGRASHPWDAMVFGAFLIGAALGIRRWLAQGPDGVRAGFTARRLSGRDAALLEAATTAATVVTPDMMPRPEPGEGKVRFGGGEFGGGGASSDF